MTSHALTSIVAAFRTLVAALLLLASSAVALAGDIGNAVPGEVLVKLRSGAALAAVLGRYPLALADRFGARPIFRFRVVGAASVSDVLAALRADGDVLIAEPNFVDGSPEARKNVVWAIGTPDAYATQWAPQAMHLPAALRVATGAGVRVAVLDTGVDRTHPALAGRLLPGYDFVDGDPDPSERGTTTDPGFGHGTHVAGLIALAAPNATIMPLRVLDAAGVGNAWVMAEALLHAADPDGDPNTGDGAHVVNLSLGSASRTRLFDTLSAIVSCTVPDAAEPVDPALDLSDPGYDDDKTRCRNFGGAVVVAAAGNDGSDAIREYPAAESAYGLLAVGASAADGQLARFSNFGSWIDVAAPGDHLTSAIPGGGYGTWSGTSMAAPLVAGVAALVRQLDTASDAETIVRRILRHTSALCGTKLRQVDALAAVQGTQPPAATCR